MGDHQHTRISNYRDVDRLDMASRDRVDIYGARDRDRSRDRDRDGDRDREIDRQRDRLDHDRERDAYSGRNGHGVGLSSLIVRADSGGSAGYRRDSPYDHPDGDRDHYASSQYEGIDGGPGGDKLYISNLSESVTEDGLAALVNEAGTVTFDRKSGARMLRIYRVKETGIREAEVVLNDPRSAADIIDWLDGYELKGSKIRVSLGQPPYLGSSTSRHRNPDFFAFDHERDGPPPPPPRGYRRGRGRGRFGDRPPPPPFPAVGMEPDMPPFGRNFNGPGHGPPDRFPPRNDSFGRNNPNIMPREGDWICSEPTCGNLNFARRTHCNNCNKPRRDTGGFGVEVAGPPKDVRGQPPPQVFMGGPSSEHGMGRGMVGFGPPPSVWGRGGPRDFDRGAPFRVSANLRPGKEVRERPDYREREDHRDREKFDRHSVDRILFKDVHRDRERSERYHDKRGADYGMRSDGRHASPIRLRWVKDIRNRSRSPVRGPSRDYHLDQRRDDRREEGRDQVTY